MSRYASRKFLIALAVLGVTTVALFDDLVGEETFKSIAVWVLGLYGAANVGQKVTSKEPLQ